MAGMKLADYESSVAARDFPGTPLRSRQVQISPAPSPTKKSRGRRAAYLVTNGRRLGVFLTW